LFVFGVVRVLDAFVCMDYRMKDNGWVGFLAAFMAWHGEWRWEEHNKHHCRHHWIDTDTRVWET
jgi:hypothetical protein